MKGPYERLKYDLRRLWECPVCKRRERTDGGVTFRFCECGTKQEGGRPAVMKLIADGPQRLVPVIAGAREFADDSAPIEVASGVRVFEKTEDPESDGEATISDGSETPGS